MFGHKNPGLFNKKLSLPFIGFLQAVGVLLYTGFVGLIIMTGGKYFGSTPSIIAPIFVLSLLVLSVLICGLLTFGYAIILFWDKKQTKEAVKLIAYSAMWLAIFISIILIKLLVDK